MLLLFSYVDLLTCDENGTHEYQIPFRYIPKSRGSFLVSFENVVDFAHVLLSHLEVSLVDLDHTYDPMVLALNMVDVDQKNSTTRRRAHHFSCILLISDSSVLQSTYYNDTFQE